MKISVSWIFGPLLLLSALPLPAADPYLGYLYPCGAQTGTRVQILIGGQRLNGMTDVWFSDNAGIKIHSVKIVPNFPFPDWKQRLYLREWLQNIDAGKPEEKPTLPDDADQWRKHPWWEQLDQLDPLSRSIVSRDLNIWRNPLQATPSIRQMAIVDLEIEPDAAPGIRTFHLFGKNNGVSNGKLFFVDSVRHITEPLYCPRKNSRIAPEVRTFPAVLNGQVMPQEPVDTYLLHLEKDTPYRFTVSGRILQPFIGDAVPGYFQPNLRLLDDSGYEVAQVSGYEFNPDPVLCWTPHKSADYTLEVRDNLFRGREDFVYRVLIDSAETPDTPFLKPTPCPDLPETTADQWSGTPLENPSEPQIIAGCLKEPRQADMIRFTGKTGQKLVLDVIARRNGSPLDPVLTLFDPNGKRLLEADDSAPKWNVGLIMQHFDPTQIVTLPADGIYTLRIADRTHAGGEDYRYWLRIGTPVPDCRVYTVQSFLNIRAEGGFKLKLFAERLDGFEGEIRIVSPDLELAGKPVFKPGESEKTITLRNHFPAERNPREITLFLEFKRNGKIVRKPVTPADEFMQAFAYNHLVPSEHFLLATLPKWNPPKKQPPKPAPDQAKASGKNGTTGKDGKK